MAQLVERLLSIPEVRGSTPVIGKINIEHLFSVKCIEMMEIKKEAGNGPFFEEIFFLKNPSYQFQVRS